MPTDLASLRVRQRDLVYKLVRAIWDENTEAQDTLNELIRQNNEEQNRAYAANPDLDTPEDAG